MDRTTLRLHTTAKLAAHLRHPVYCILGNHDFIEFVPFLEEAGLTFLLNETVPIEHKGAEIYLSGVDDPHFYETDNLHKTRDLDPAQLRCRSCWPTRRNCIARPQRQATTSC